MEFKVRNFPGEIKGISGAFEIVITGELIVDDEFIEATIRPDTLNPFKNRGYDVNTAMNILHDSLNFNSEPLFIMTSAAYKIDTEKNDVEIITVNEKPEYYPSDCVPNPMVHYHDMGMFKRSIMHEMREGNYDTVSQLLIRCANFHSLRDFTLTQKLFEDIASGKYHCFRDISDWDWEEIPLSFDDIYLTY